MDVEVLEREEKVGGGGGLLRRKGSGSRFWWLERVGVAVRGLVGKRRKEEGGYVPLRDVDVEVA